MRLFALAALIASPAFASSDDAWAQFRVDVGAACLALVQGPGTATIEVNNFGSESYGVALVTLTSTEGQDRMVCIYDKASKKAELSAAFGQ
ncbi:MAG: hypothetical protein DI533_05590 [Cereibacter sphaeroides]|uniref:Uncharacterized protein n=1 Tax=Cereibacter sphaeroides TaxID=1063 RepID=A0A2W5SAN3_CERSP|nr:MAG: hypothetical protein DI533_05590 [Cereibacter sphaeroides]